jgi:hypothetical protein
MLKVTVAGFMQRDPTIFLRTVGATTVDLLLQAANNARLYAERKIDFELSKTDVDVPAVTLNDGGNLNNAVLHSDGTTPVRIKKIITPFIPMSNGHQYPVDLWDRKKWDDRVKARFEAARPTDTEDFAFITDAPFVVIQSGNVVYVTPPDVSQFTSTFKLFFNVVAWLPTYEDGTENDFLLDNAFDWMMFYCISQLNFYLKEDERVAISEKMLADTWDSLVKWNNEMIMSSVDTTDLD